MEKVEEENIHIRTEVAKAKEGVQSITEERDNLRKELEAKLRVPQTEQNDVEQKNKDLASVNQGLKKRVKELERESLLGREMRG